MTLRFLLSAIFLCGGILIPVATAWPQVDSTPEAEQMDFAQSLLARGMYEMSIAEYQKFMAAYPQSAELESAHLAIAEAYFLWEHFSESIDAFKRFKQAYAHSPKQAIAVLRLGQIYINQGKFSEALGELTSISATAQLKGEEQQAFYFYCAKASRGKGDKVTALTYAEMAVRVEGALAYTPYALELAAEIHIEMKQYDQAVRAYVKASELTPEELLKAHFIYKVGETLFLAGDYPRAIEQFKRVLTQTPSSDLSVFALTNLCLAYFNTQQYDELLKAYKDSKILKDSVAFFDAHFTAARAFIEQKKYDEAQALLSRILTFAGIKDEGKQKARVKQAFILVKQRKFQEAIKLLDQNLNTISDEGLFLKAQAFVGLGNFAQASRNFELVQTKYPDSDFNRATQLGLAHSYREAGKFKEAFEVFLRYYDSKDPDPSKGDALYYALLMQVKLNANGQAMALAQEYVTNFPQGPFFEDVLLLLAELFVRGNQAERAVDLLRGDLKQSKKADAVNFLLAYAWQTLQQWDKALAAYALVVLNKEDPRFYISALKNSTIILIEQKKPVEAAEILNRLIMELGQNTLDLRSYLWLSNHYLKEKKFKEALGIVQKAEARFVGQANEQINYFKAEANRAMGQCGEATGFYNAVLKSKERDTFTGGAHLGKGLCFVEAKNFELANAEFQLALTENADDPSVSLRARYEIANAAYAQRNLNDALKFYLLVGSLYDDPAYAPESLLRAGAILEGQAHSGEAKKVYSDILASYQGSPQAITAKERMSKIK